MKRILVPTEEFAEEVRQAIRAEAPERAVTVDVAVWHIDSETPPPGAELIITARPMYPERFSRIAAIDGLKHVHLLSLGYEWVLPFLGEHVTLSNSKGAVEDATAEFAMALILASVRRLPQEVLKQQSKVWERGFYTTSIAHSKVLVLGFGGVGTEVVKRLEPFRPASITVMAGRARTEGGYQVHGPGALPELLPDADIVVMTLPHTPATEELVNAEFLRRMADGALLVNVGRGKLVHHGDLMAELRTGRIHAALDVVDPEPLPADSPLWETPNLLIASHVGGNTTEFVRLSYQFAAEHAVRLLRDETLPNLIQY